MQWKKKSYRNIKSNKTATMDAFSVYFSVSSRLVSVTLNTVGLFQSVNHTLCVLLFQEAKYSFPDHHPWIVITARSMLLGWLYR